MRYDLATVLAARERLEKEYRVNARVSFHGYEKVLVNDGSSYETTESEWWVRGETFPWTYVRDLFDTLCRAFEVTPDNKVTFVVVEGGSIVSLTFYDNKVVRVAFGNHRNATRIPANYVRGGAAILAAIQAYNNTL